MNKDQFVAIVNRNGSLHEKDLEDIEFNWRAANEAALSVSAAMPGIGFFSVKQRLNAFFAACRHFDKLIDERGLTEEQAQLGISILRLINSKFKKAVIIFETRSKRFDATAHADMPRTARQYLAGIQYIGY
jgi:hypothetical protein|tara:strand:+ start:1328 stop:1720 length:393 start_codon:yes stop_codon:yes gene_type:complete